MLNNIENKNPFKTPDNYFERFNVDIMNSLPEKKTRKTVRLWKTVSKWTAIAATIVGVAFVGVNYLDNNQSVTPSTKNNDAKNTIEDDYYSFIEEEATQSIYRDAFFVDN